MKPKIHYFRVSKPSGAFTFIGGPIKPGSPGKVWLCQPDGEPVLEVRAECVKPTTRQETAKRIQADLSAIGKSKGSPTRPDADFGFNDYLAFL